MSSTFEILSAHEIDPAKWNSCVQDAENGLIYSRYEYLTGICDNWHGLVINNYEAIMALPWRKKFAVRYLYEPAFIQQLGAIGSLIPAETFYNIFSFVKYGDVLLNYSDTSLAEKTNATSRTNLVIDLSQGYLTITAKYRKDLQQNLKKAQQAALQISAEPEIGLAITFYKNLYQERFQHITDTDFERFKALCFELIKNDMCFTRKVMNNSGELLSIGLFLKDGKRIYNIMNTTTAKGRKLEANHYLIDAVIKEFAGQKLIFDFEGSDLPGVKQFYEKFGAVNQSYFHYHFNKLPFPLRLLKK